MTARVTARATIALAVADFRERVRRPAYAVILLAAVGLARLAVPPADSRWVILDVGGYRGVYTSAWVGTATALAGALWLTLGGFYLVRDAIGRDERTRVGQLVAATPLRTSAYLLGKFLSDFLVLASMAGVLAVTALIMQLARGESGAVDPVALLLPFVTITLPPLALTAAAAVLFETVPLLRGGVGNVVWFVVSLVLLIGGQSRRAPLGGLGVHAATQGAADSMRAALAAQGVDVHGREFSLGLTSVARPLRTFHWDGFSVAGAFLGGRLLVVLMAVVLALLPCLWFARFDPARRLTAPAVTPYEPGVTAEGRRPAFLTTLRTAPRVAPRPGRALRRLLSGELRILLQGVSRLWWLVAAGVTAAAFATPDPATMLPFAWIWPVLVWSRLGTQRVEYGVEGLLGAYPAPWRGLLAEWAAGVVLTAVTGVGPLVRMAVAADWPGVGSWAGGALLVPSLALALGAACRTHRVFQVVYLGLWYLAVNGTAAVDYMGAVRVEGLTAGPSPLAVAGLAAALLFAALAVRTARHAAR
ncbi:ABC transporter permease [Microbispora sp. KK1-11]|uniref:ABC transporter permease n=1 Tax=Microbispora sp. KK1-11 TaxID=2053005 RepID=UPI00115A0841|nr:ABC transporter permease [Microbispora sp. KK1-11]TQS27384.1 ABC transporter permease [Microbispora sp. KK1-11]